jgi:hypothetical protein
MGATAIAATVIRSKPVPIGMGIHRLARRDATQEFFRR